MGSKSEKEARATDTVEDNSTITEVKKTTETPEDALIEQNKVKKKTSSYHANCKNTGGPSWDWKKGRKSSRSKSSDGKKSGNVSSSDSAKMSNDDSPKDEKEIKKKTSLYHTNCTEQSPRKTDQKSSRSNSSDSKKSRNVSSPESEKVSSDDSPKDETEIKKKTSSFHANCTNTRGPSWDWKKERKSSRSVSSDSKKSGNISSPESEKVPSDDLQKEEKEIKKKSSLYHTNCTKPDGLEPPTWKTDQNSSTSTREDSKKSENVSSPESKNKNQDESPKDEKKIKKETSSRHDNNATSDSNSNTNKNTSKKMDPVTGKKKSNQVTDKNNQDNKPFPNPHNSGGNIDGFVPKPPSTVKYSRSCNCVRNSSSTASKSTKNKNQAGSKRTENQKEAASKASEKQDAAASKTTEKQNQDVKPFPSPKENDTISDAEQGTETIDNPQDEPKIDGNPF